MEKRTVLAIVLAIVFIIGWQKFVVERLAPQEKNAAISKKKQVAHTSDNLNEKDGSKFFKPEEAVSKNNVKDLKVEEALKSNDMVLSSENNIDEKEYYLENDFIKIVFTNKGGVAKKIILKKYKDKNGDFYDLVNRAINYDKPFTLYINDISLENLLFNTEAGNNTIKFFANVNGSQVVKTFTLKDDYLLDFSIEGLNDVFLSLGAGLNSSEKPESRYSTEDEVAYFYDDEVNRISKKKLKKEQIPVEAEWVAIENRYFAKILTPSNGFNKLKAGIYTYSEGKKNYTVSFLKVSLKQPFKGWVYLGPKEYERLGNLGNDYKGLVNFGWFGAFGKWLFIFLKWLNKFVGNWGWSIVIFTILVRILLFPLNSAGLKSAQKMKELQPKVKAIQEKYKKYGNDMTMKAKMNQELQELYKKEGVNPLGGCLPMVVQIPIFFAIYSLLLNIIDLRMAPWILWIKDLSAHDPYFVLPIAMGATQLIVQLLTPAVGDKNQQKMMLIMPIVITFVLIYAPSGLLLYWTTNNIFQIFQQLILNKQMKTVA